jgi:hypothetical protein
MGASLVKLAYERALEAQLDHAPMRVLTFMAVTALDKTSTKTGDPPDRYYYGRIPLARALGYGRTNPDDADSKAAHSAVARAVQTLLDEGVIKLRESAHSGRSAEYDLTPLRSPWTVDNRRVQAKKVPAHRVREVPAQRDERYPLSVPEVPGERAPLNRNQRNQVRNHQEEHGEIEKERTRV